MLNQTQTQTSKTPIQDNQLSQIKNLMNFVKNSSNPQEALQSLAMQNQQVRNVIDFVNKNGGDPKTAFYNLAQQKGVNPDDILKMLSL